VHAFREVAGTNGGGTKPDMSSGFEQSRAIRHATQRFEKQFFQRQVFAPHGQS
jgi:hypothetical protein